MFWGLEPRALPWAIALRPFGAWVAANATQSRTLATLRDTLLPKLLSWELSVAGGNYSVLSNSSNRRETNP